jgi:hypothetical protein
MHGAGQAAAVFKLEKLCRLCRRDRQGILALSLRPDWPPIAANRALPGAPGQLAEARWRVTPCWGVTIISIRRGLGGLAMLATLSGWVGFYQVNRCCGPILATRDDVGQRRQSSAARYSEMFRSADGTRLAWRVDSVPTRKTQGRRSFPTTGAGRFTAIRPTGGKKNTPTRGLTERSARHPRGERRIPCVPDRWCC